MELLAISDDVWKALIGAAVILIPIILDYRAKQRTQVLSKSLDETKSDVQKIEKATNSMKDALVAATGKAENLQGRADERAEQRAREPVIAPIALKSSIEEVREDVKEVKADVKDVKAEVLKPPPTT